MVNYYLVAAAFPMLPATSIAPAAHQENCLAICFADDDYVDNSGSLWDMTWSSPSHGTGTDPGCEPCTPCSVEFKFAYLGSGPWRWRWGPQSGSGPNGPTDLGFLMINECDGDSGQIRFVDENGNLSIALLYCTCQY